MMFAQRCFPLLGLELWFFGDDGGFSSFTQQYRFRPFLGHPCLQAGLLPCSSCGKFDLLASLYWKTASESDPPEIMQTILQSSHLESALSEFSTHNLSEPQAIHHCYSCSLVLLSQYSHVWTPGLTPRSTVQYVNIIIGKVRILIHSLRGGSVRMSGRVFVV